jgi:hypothetical protein
VFERMIIMSFYFGELAVEREVFIGGNGFARFLENGVVVVNKTGRAAVDRK